MQKISFHTRINLNKLAYLLSCLFLFSSFATQSLKDNKLYSTTVINETSCVLSESEEKEKDTNDLDEIAIPNTGVIANPHFLLLYILQRKFTHIPPKSLFRSCSTGLSPPV